MFFWRLLITFGSFLEPCLPLLDHFWQLLATFGILGCLCTTFGRRWASFGFNLGALGAAWSPWAPIWVSEHDFLLIFGWFGPHDLTKIVKIPQESKLKSKFEIKSSTHNVLIAISRLVSIHGCGGLRVAVSIISPNHSAYKTVLRFLPLAQKLVVLRKLPGCQNERVKLSNLSTFSDLQVKWTVLYCFALSISPNCV